jgi:hypothetical protein
VGGRPWSSLAGAYRLRLDVHAERCVAAALLRASLEEGEWRRDPQRGVNWRNASLDGVSLPSTTISALDAFSLPEAGLLELDYVTVVPEVVRSQRAERMQKAKGTIRGLGRKALLKHMSPSSKGTALSSMLQKLTRQAASEGGAAGSERGRVGGGKTEWAAAASAWRGKYKTAADASVFSPTEFQALLREVDAVVKEEDAGWLATSAGADLHPLSVFVEELGGDGTDAGKKGTKGRRQPKAGSMTLAIAEAKRRAASEARAAAKLDRAARLSQLLRVRSVMHFITVAQLELLLAAVGDGGLDGGESPRLRSRVDAFVTWNERVINRHQLSDALRTLPDEEQVGRTVPLASWSKITRVLPEPLKQSIFVSAGGGAATAGRAEPVGSV